LCVSCFFFLPYFKCFFLNFMTWAERKQFYLWHMSETCNAQNMYFWTVQQCRHCGRLQTALLHSAVQTCTLQKCTVQKCTVHFCTVHFCTALCRGALCRQCTSAQCTSAQCRRTCIVSGCGRVHVLCVPADSAPCVYLSVSVCMSVCLSISVCVFRVHA